MFLWWIPWLLRSWAFFVGFLIFHPVADTTDIARRNGTLNEFNELIDDGFSDSRNIRTVNKKSELSSKMVSYNSLFRKANKNKKFAEVSSEFELTRLDIDDNADVSADAQAKYIENGPSNFALVNFELNNPPHLTSNIGVNENKINIANYKRITKRLNNNPSLLWRITTNSVAKHNIISKTGNKVNNNSRSSSNRPWHFTNVDENLNRPFKIFINNSKSHDNIRVNSHQNILQEQTFSRKYSKENLTSEKYKFHGRRLINHEFKKGNANSKNMITNDFLNMPDISSRSINSNKFKRKKSDSKTSYVSQSSKIFLENKNFTKSDKSVLSNKSNINSVIISVCEDISKNPSTKINISNVSFDAKHISTTKSSTQIGISQSHVKANSVEALNSVLIDSQDPSTYQRVPLKRLKKRSVNNDHLAVNPSSTKSVSLKNRKAGNSGTLNLSKKPKNISIEEAGMGGSALQPPVSSSNAQRFATQPAPQTAVIGSTAVLPCRVTGKVGHLQWTKDGFGLGTDRDLYGFSRYSMIGSDDEGDFSLRMNPVLLDDDALYQCQVSASDGVPGIRSQPVRLTVYVPPDPPVVEPTVLNTTSGMAVELQCQSKGGRPPPEIQWVDDSKRETILNGATDSVQMMEDGKRTVVTSKMTFTPRRHHNNQTVTCLTSNQALSSPLIASISLHVFFPPEVTLSSHPEQFIEGDDATFYCDSVANPPRVTFRWFHNAQELVNETSRELKISRISRVYHQDSISCEVSNKVGLSKKSQTMYVRFGPTFRTKPQDVMAEDGSNADLSCDVESNPTASISWLRDGSEKIIGSGASLRVQVSRSTAGIYKCVASVRGRDVEFPNLEGKVRVLVKGPPQIVSASEQQGRMGDTVSLECRTVSVPSPIRVTWTYKGRKIDLNDPRYDVLQDEGKGNHRNVLVIHDADSTDFGDYNCSVVNEYGVARKLIRLKEEKRVPVLLVVGCGASVVVVAVVIVSLVFCNKKHPSNKGQCEAVKDNKPNVTDPNQTPIANMYSAPSETKLDEGPLSSFPSPFTEVKVSPMPTNSVSYSMRPLNGDTRTNATNAEDFERDYTTFIETAAEVRGRRRSSLTDSSIYPLPGMGGTNPSGMPITSPPEFCTIRRTPRTQSPPVISTYPNGNVGIGLNHRSVNNGSIQLCSNRHSAYINSSIGHNPTSYSPPPPPPYPRNLSSIPLDGGGGITSPPKGSILVDNSGNLMTSNQEAKYIFSPEAMLKPGTLV